MTDAGIWGHTPHSKSSKSPLDLPATPCENKSDPKERRIMIINQLSIVSPDRAKEKKAA